MNAPALEPLDEARDAVLLIEDLHVEIRQAGHVTPVDVSRKPDVRESG